MFSNLAKLLEAMNEYTLGKEYSYEDGGKNLGNRQLLNFKQKIIVIADKSNSSFLANDALKEFINNVEGKFGNIISQNQTLFNNTISL